MSTEDDRTLVHRCILGDPPAWNDLIRLLSPWIHAVISRTLRSSGISFRPDDVEEIGWNTFEALLENDCRSLRDFRWDCPLERFAGRIARIQAIHWIRFRLRTDPEKLVPGLLPKEPGDPSSVLSIQERQQRVRDALARLPEKDRSLLEAVYFEDRTYDELASRLKSPSNTVATWISRAKRKLLALLDDLRLPLL